MHRPAGVLRRLVAVLDQQLASLLSTHLLDSTAGLVGATGAEFSHSSCQGPHLGRSVVRFELVAIWKSSHVWRARARFAAHAAGAAPAWKRVTVTTFAGTTLDMLRHVTILSNFAVLLSSPAQTL